MKFSEKRFWAGSKITRLPLNQVFVFGANQAGRHGAGAAKTALEKFGAVYGKVGLRGQSYGLCTKNENIQTLSLSEIRKEIEVFVEVANKYSHMDFLLTEVGCGLAGYKVSDIAPLFKNVESPNIIFPETFKEFLI